MSKRYHYDKPLQLSKTKWNEPVADFLIRSAESVCAAQWRLVSKSDLREIVSVRSGWTWLQTVSNGRHVTSNADPLVSAGKVFQLLVFVFSSFSLFFPLSPFPPLSLIIYSFHLFFYSCVIHFTFCFATNVYYCSLLVACCITCQHCADYKPVHS